MASAWADSHPNDVFAHLERLVLESNSFQWTGNKPKQVLAKDLKDCGFSDIANDLLWDSDDTYVQRVHEALELMFDSDWSCRVGVVQGPPGSGKSRLLSLFADVASNPVVVLPDVSLLSNHTKRGAVFTIRDLITRHHDYARYHCFVVDEYTLVNVCEVLLAAYIVGVRSIVFFGDPVQGLGYDKGSERYFNFPIMALSKVTYRLPSKIVDFYNRVHGTNLISKVSFEGNLDIEGDFRDPIPDDAVALVLSESGRKRVLPIQAELVSAVQGREFSTVVLFIVNEDVKLLADRALTSVAFSRATETLILRSESEELTVKLLARLPFGQSDCLSAKEHLPTFFGKVGRMWRNATSSW